MDGHNPNLAYLDCAATTPVEIEVLASMVPFFEVEYGNAGSRTHEYGLIAQQASQNARDHIAALVGLSRENVVLTSGATESNNLAILGIADFGNSEGTKHFVTTQVEHKAVLEPTEFLEDQGYEITRVAPNSDGFVEPDRILDAVRPDTVLVSVMHVNNETGVTQSIGTIADELTDHPTYIHVDAAQSYGKLFDGLENSRIDLISLSGHKIYGPKGIGALLMRPRNYQVPPLRPLMYGGGQEQGLRPGTLPVPLAVGLGTAAKLAMDNHETRTQNCLDHQTNCLALADKLGGQLNGAPGKLAPQIMNLSFPGLDSEAVMIGLKGVAAVSNGSACTSASYEPSHVLKAMGLDQDRVAGAIRFSWSHLTGPVDWDQIETSIRRLM
jgi:cysteine desulfurase